MEMKSLVHVIDDDDALRDSVRLLLASIDIEVACYATAQEFLDESDSIVQPGCILLDLRMPQMSGLELQRMFGERHRHLPTIFLSGHADVDASVRAMHQGAADFLTKPVNDELLLETIHTAIERSKKERAECNERASLQARLDLLTPREREVLDGVYEGFSNKEIARKLRISHKTVELHRSTMMTKMHADSLAELVRMRTQLEPAPGPGAAQVQP